MMGRRQRTRLGEKLQNQVTKRQEKLRLEHDMFKSLQIWSVRRRVLSLLICSVIQSIIEILLCVVNVHFPAQFTPIISPYIELDVVRQNDWCEMTRKMYINFAQWNLRNR